MTKNKFIEFFKCIHRANQAEIEQIKGLVVTDKDKKEAEYIQHICALALAEFGIPPTLAQSQVINTALAYAIRDLKEGGKNPSTLLIRRIVKEVRESKKQS